jgi:hypothetical protein
VTRWGEISVLKSNKYISDARYGFGISPYMQELMVYAGHLDCYAKSNEILEHFTHVQVNQSQIYRVTESVSESLKGEDSKAERKLKPLSKDDVLYVEIDGSMVCTRDVDSWKEVKLGRLFRDADCLNPNTESAYLCDSHYVGHFGTCVDFCNKLKQVIDAYGDLKNRLVFINDGAAWIREWIADNYPLAVSVLDFYHATEYLYGFAEKAFPNAPLEKKQWCDSQKKLLLDSQVKSVIENIEAANAKEEDKKKITGYYQNNTHRMKYKQYRNTGCGIIGSGAIEAAHRTVIQKRMKLSGQRWSINGVKNMLRLQVISKNNQWAKVIDILKTPPIAKCA